MSVLGGDVDDRIESKLEEFGDRRLGALVVRLVHREQHRASGLAQFAGNALVPGDQTLAAINDHHNQIGARDSPLPLHDDELVERIFAGAEEPSGIHQLKRDTAPFAGPRQRVARGAGDGGDDSAAAAGNSVE